MAGGAVVLYLSDACLDALKMRAQELRVPYSALADFMLALALEKARPETIQAWLKQRATPEITPKQGRVLEALRSLTTPETYRFDVGSVADAADMPPREAYRALKALQGRGEVAGAEGSELDRWGRPLESWWRLTRLEDVKTGE
jgi:hypothetical protein